MTQAEVNLLLAVGVIAVLGALAYTIFSEPKATRGPWAFVIIGGLLLVLAAAFLAARLGLFLSLGR